MTTLRGQRMTHSQGWWGRSSDAFKQLDFLTLASSGVSKDYFKQILSSNKPDGICQPSCGQRSAVSGNTSHLDAQFVLPIRLPLMTRLEVLGHRHIRCQRGKSLAVCKPCS